MGRLGQQRVCSGGQTALLALLSACLLLGLNAQDASCPEFKTTETIVETAPGCINQLEIPFDMKSDVYSSTTITILDVGLPNAFLLHWRAACRPLIS